MSGRSRMRVVLYASLRDGTEKTRKRVSKAQKTKNTEANYRAVRAFARQYNRGKAAANRLSVKRNGMLRAWNRSGLQPEHAARSYDVSISFSVRGRSRSSVDEVLMLLKGLKTSTIKDSTLIAYC